MLNVYNEAMNNTKYKVSTTQLAIQKGC